MRKDTSFAVSRPAEPHSLRGYVCLGAFPIRRSLWLIPGDCSSVLCSCAVGHRRIDSILSRNHGNVYIEFMLCVLVCVFVRVCVRAQRIFMLTINVYTIKDLFGNKHH